MDVRRLETFVKVAELRSFSRAAEALFLTQPTVSEHVRSLEDELGVQLLDRLGHGAAPTRAGLLLLDYARRILALAREARQAIDRFQGRMAGQLVVGGSTIPGEYVLPGLIGQFKGKYPDISMSLLIGDSREASAWVEEGRAEIALVGACPASRALEAKAVMQDELVVVVPAGHRWAGRAAVTIGELQGEPLIVREQGSGSRETMERALATVQRDLGGFRVAGEMGSTQAIKQAVRIPVIANGDVTSPHKARDVLAATGADALMIGRAAQGRPWIFREIAHFLATGRVALISAPQTRTVRPFFKAASQIAPVLAKAIASSPSSG